MRQCDENGVLEVEEETPAISRVFKICNAYESGFGHGLKKDGRLLSPFLDAELSEAYELGYQKGAEG